MEDPSYPVRVHSIHTWDDFHAIWKQLQYNSHLNLKWDERNASQCKTRVGRLRGGGLTRIMKKSVWGVRHEILIKFSDRQSPDRKTLARYGHAASIFWVLTN